MARHQIGRRQTNTSPASRRRADSSMPPMASASGSTPPLRMSAGSFLIDFSVATTLLVALKPESILMAAACERMPLSSRMNSAPSLSALVLATSPELPNSLSQPDRPKNLRSLSLQIRVEPVRLVLQGKRCTVELRLLDWWQVVLFYLGPTGGAGGALA